VLAVFTPRSVRVGAIAVVTLVALAVLGAVGAALGGAPRGRGALRTLVLSTTALVLSYAVGKAIGVAV
jgi:VIT1/CCC1 family predicted Fe2+/Mn2+ transporter